MAAPNAGRGRVLSARGNWWGIADAASARKAWASEAMVLARELCSGDLSESSLSGASCDNEIIADVVASRFLVFLGRANPYRGPGRRGASRIHATSDVPRTSPRLHTPRCSVAPYKPEILRSDSRRPHPGLLRLQRTKKKIVWRVSTRSSLQRESRPPHARKPAPPHAPAIVRGTQRYALVSDPRVRPDPAVAHIKLLSCASRRARTAPSARSTHFSPPHHPFPRTTDQDPPLFTAQVSHLNDMAGADGAMAGTPDATYAALEVPRTFSSAPEPVRTSVLSHSKSHPRMLESAFFILALFPSCSRRGAPRTPN